MFSIIQAYTIWTYGDHQNKWIDNNWEYSIADKSETWWTTNILDKNTNLGPKLLDNISDRSQTRNRT